MTLQQAPFSPSKQFLLVIQGHDGSLLPGLCLFLLLAAKSRDELLVSQNFRADESQCKIFPSTGC